MKIYLDNMPKIEVLLGITKKEWFEIDNIDFQEETFDVLDELGQPRTYNFIGKTIRIKEFKNERKSIQ
ncbi:MAG: hypothetical protein [Bacteriophage sp.]|nr:MAG: hypothetical protein [Bacteriophage sp.]UVM91511.1 MAG: hypothetical protein [Bacteriophage sp.]UVN01794.1 MAG: hypothetical protein [Bacteriophage sp.]UVX36054.1 MAG: hypothetical protein [Bacteriophage sp.]UVX80420.1 MAG: hypothetical protein [Bacteriophage sp.]